MDLPSVLCATAIVVMSAWRRQSRPHVEKNTGNGGGGKRQRGGGGGMTLRPPAPASENAVGLLKRHWSMLYAYCRWFAGLTPRKQHEEIQKIRGGAQTERVAFADREEMMKVSYEAARASMDGKTDDATEDGLKTVETAVIAVSATLLVLLVASNRKNIVANVRRLIEYVRTRDDEGATTSQTDDDDERVKSPAPPAKDAPPVPDAPPVKVVHYGRVKATDESTWQSQVEEQHAGAKDVTEIGHEGGFHYYTFVSDKTLTGDDVFVLTDDPNLKPLPERPLTLRDLYWTEVGLCPVQTEFEKHMGQCNAKTEAELADAFFFSSNYNAKSQPPSLESSATRTDDHKTQRVGSSSAVTYVRPDVWTYRVITHEHGGARRFYWSEAFEWINFTDFPPENYQIELENGQKYSPEDQNEPQPNERVSAVIIGSKSHKVRDVPSQVMYKPVLELATIGYVAFTRSKQRWQTDWVVINEEMSEPEGVIVNINLADGTKVRVASFDALVEHSREMLFSKPGDLLTEELTLERTGSYAIGDKTFNAIRGNTKGGKLELQHITVLRDDQQVQGIKADTSLRKTDKITIAREDGETRESITFENVDANKKVRSWVTGQDVYGPQFEDELREYQQEHGVWFGVLSPAFVDKHPWWTHHYQVVGPKDDEGGYFTPVENFQIGIEDSEELSVPVREPRPQDLRHNKIKNGDVKPYPSPDVNLTINEYYEREWEPLAQHVLNNKKPPRRWLTDPVSTELRTLLNVDEERLLRPSVNLATVPKPVGLFEEHLRGRNLESFNKTVKNESWQFQSMFTSETKRPKLSLLKEACIQSHEFIINGESKTDLKNETSNFRFAVLWKNVPVCWDPDFEFDLEPHVRDFKSPFSVMFNDTWYEDVKGNKKVTFKPTGKNQMRVYTATGCALRWRVRMQSKPDHEKVFDRRPEFVKCADEVQFQLTKNPAPPTYKFKAKSAVDFMRLIGPSLNETCVITEISKHRRNECTTLYPHSETFEPTGNPVDDQRHFKVYDFDNRRYPLPVGKPKGGAVYFESIDAKYYMLKFDNGFVTYTDRRDVIEHSLEMKRPYLCVVDDGMFCIAKDRFSEVVLENVACQVRRDKLYIPRRTATTSFSTTAGKTKIKYMVPGGQTASNGSVSVANGAHGPVVHLWPEPESECPTSETFEFAHVNTLFNYIVKFKKQDKPLEINGSSHGETFQGKIIESIRCTLKHELKPAALETYWPGISKGIKAWEPPRNFPKAAVCVGAAVATGTLYHISPWVLGLTALGATVVFADLIPDMSGTYSAGEGGKDITTYNNRGNIIHVLTEGDVTVHTGNSPIQGQFTTSCTDTYCEWFPKNNNQGRIAMQTDVVSHHLQTVFRVYFNTPITNGAIVNRDGTPQGAAVVPRGVDTEVVVLNDPSSLVLAYEAKRQQAAYDAMFVADMNKRVEEFKRENPNEKVPTYDQVFKKTCLSPDANLVSCRGLFDYMQGHENDTFGTPTNNSLRFDVTIAQMPQAEPNVLESLGKAGLTIAVGALVTSAAVVATGPIIGPAVGLQMGLLTFASAHAVWSADRDYQNNKAIHKTMEDLRYQNKAIRSGETVVTQLPQEGGADDVIKWCIFPPDAMGEPTPIHVVVRLEDDRFVLIRSAKEQRDHVDLSLGQFFPFARVWECGEAGRSVPVHVTGSGMSRNEVVDVQVVHESGIMRVRLPLNTPMPRRHRCDC